MKYARRRCTRNTKGASPTHTMVTDDKALCGVTLMRPTEYWEEMTGGPAEGFMPEGGSEYSEHCHNCYMITEARAGRV